MKPIKDFFPLLANPGRIVITTHQKPDADAMGACLGLRIVLHKLGHQVTVLSPTNWAAWLNWMPGCNTVLDYEKEREKSEMLLNEADWLFCLDFNIFHRTKNLAPKLAALTCRKILIDHHQEPDTASFDYGISDTGKSSTCEMIFDLVRDSGYLNLLDQTSASCLYAGVVGDTGNFKFSSTTASVHRMVAELMDRGLDHTRVQDGLFENFLENRLRFFGHILLNRMEVFYEYNTVLVAISKNDLLKYQIRTGDTEGLVNIPQSIQGMKLVAMVVDRDEERKWSFRSKGDFDANLFARKYFEGGGHFYASGGRSSDTLEKTIQYFKEVIRSNKHLLQ